ncbi:FAD-dependent oxidoreductase [Roseibacillus ishigakijimensis]|uniref:FAD-dependent oxidoreductase n=1 Tax=Roseibacillus ishigakijimensis TaxID=454146 RepID=A0A934RL83_9BACT|nr:FAD-dependent oxidoreductase [Roseibacillus ishigakijimensis]
MLGGGVCGLYAAHHALARGARVVLLEKEERYGGLAAGHLCDGNWFDLGVHMLHAFDREVFETCREAMGGERLEVPLKSHIKWGGKLYHYPLRGRDILAGIPPLTLARCLGGLALAELESRFPSRPPGADAESALIELYGEPLYEFFFEDFTHRYWGLHPRELSAEFVRRKMPRLSALDVFKNLLEKLHLARPRDATEGALRFETLHYSRTGSEALPRKLAESARAQGAELRSAQPVERIHHQHGRIQAVETAQGQLPVDNVLSTLPLPELVKKLSPAAPEAVRAAAARLRFKPMTVYALLLKKDRCMDALYTYYRDRIFHRVGEPKNAGLEVTPAGHTTLIVETTCEVGDRKWTGEALPDILADLAAEGLCTAEEVVSQRLIHARHAYPVFALGFEKHLAVVTDYLAGFANLRSTGRQGAFTYPNMHTAMRMGAEAAHELLS